MPEMNLSEFEREFLIANADRYHEERLRRMPMPALINEMATARFDSDQVQANMSAVADVDLIATAFRDDPHAKSATEELVKRANAKRVTLADYVYYVGQRHRK
jgi:hypothetical protein